MNINAYLERIGYYGQHRPTLEDLEALQRAHIEHIPFENLDIHLGNKIILNEERIFEKIVLRNRGGFCYELNGLFAALLIALGYKVTRLSARVYDGNTLGPEFDHLVLMVDLSETESWRYLVDVGFGDAFRIPLRMEDKREQGQKLGKYRLSQTNEGWIYWKLDEDRWQPQYTFTLRPRRLSDFSAMCGYHQSSPKSMFTKKRIITLGKPKGRVTLSEMRLIQTTHHQRHEKILPDEGAYIQALKIHFGINI